MLKQLNIAPPAPALRRAARDGDGLVRAELTPALSKLLRPGACQSMSGGAGCQGVTCREMRDVTQTRPAGAGSLIPDQTKTMARQFLSGSGEEKKPCLDTSVGLYLVYLFLSSFVYRNINLYVVLI